MTSCRVYPSRKSFRQCCWTEVKQFFSII